MQIWVHDTRMRKVTAINNAIPRMLSFYNSTWHRYLPQATNTFDFTIPKLYSGKLHEDLSFINDRAYFSFRNQGKDYVFYVANMVEDDFSIQLTCNDTNLELNNEQANAFSSDSAQTLAWYLEHMDLLAFTSLKIGINEISDRKRTLTFDSQETKLARLQSLMSQFDAEYEFVTELNNNGTFKQITLNIYQSPDSTHHGVGKVRSDVLLYYGNDVKGVQVTTDKTQLFNMAVFTGQDGLSMKDVERSDKNEDGKEEFYTRKGSEAVYAPLSAEMYPSTLRDGDNWTRKDFQTEYTDVNDLTAYAFRTMKQYAYPIITYTASVQSSFLGNYSDLALGDTVKIYDGNFVGGLALEARVTEQIISFDNPNNNSLVFSNYVKLKNTVSATLQKRLAELVEANTPYTIKLAKNNSLIFKNGQGETIITPSLYKADKLITADVTWRWSLDGNVTIGMTYTVKGAEVTEQSVLTVAAYIGNDEASVTEIDVVNVNDGANGAKGEKGDKGETGNGIANTVITYGLSTSETTEPATWASNMPVLVKGMYLWTRTVQIYTNGTSSTSYQKGYIAKDGAQGLPGTPGKDAQTQYTHIAYADNATGGGFSQTDQTKAYIGMYQDFTATNSNDPTKYLWSKWKGSDGAQGIAGKAGADGKTPYIHFAFASSADGKTDFNLTDGNQRYMGYYSDYTQADSSDYTKYKWVDRLANVQIGVRNYAEDYLFNRGIWRYTQGGGTKSYT
ncbi:phage tail protein, partial [Streptococcus gallolyticus]